MHIFKEKKGVKRLASGIALGAIILVGGWAVEARAYSGGIFGQAEAGCTCHGLGGTAAPTTRIFITGLPDGSDPPKPKGYVRGRQYDIQLVVLGVTVPPSGAGFNLHPSSGQMNVPGGDLASPDEAVRLRRETECVLLEEATGCIPGVTGNDCGVKTSCPPFDGSNLACRCSTINADCRACDDVEVFDVQASHAHPKGFPFTWNFTWTAPPEGTGPVTFHVAANVVNGDGTNGTQDLWNKLDGDLVQPPIVVPEGEIAPVLTLPIAIPAH